MQIVKGGIVESVVQPSANGALRVIMGVFVKFLRVKNHIAQEQYHTVCLVQHRPRDWLILEPIHRIYFITVAVLLGTIL